MPEDARPDPIPSDPEDPGAPRSTGMHDGGIDERGSTTPGGAVTGEIGSLGADDAADDIGGGGDLTGANDPEDDYPSAGGAPPRDDEASPPVAGLPASNGQRSDE